MDNNSGASSFQQDFWQFTDQLRLHNLSLNDSIWSSNYLSKQSDRLNSLDSRPIVHGRPDHSLPSQNPTLPSPIDIKGWNLAPQRPSSDRPPNDYNVFNGDFFKNEFSNSGFKADFNGDFFKNEFSDTGFKADFKGDFFKNEFSNGGFKADFNGFNFGWKDGFNGIDEGWKYGGSGNGSSVGFKDGGFSEGIYSKQVNFQGFNGGKLNLKGNKGKNEEIYGKGAGKKVNNRKNGENGGDDRDGKVAGDKRFKTLPPSESLPKNETVGGYIFVCNNDTMQENLKRQLFGTISF